jgi:hypothetical protein
MPLAMKIGQGCLPTIKPVIWNPKHDIECLEGWWAYGVDITDSGGPSFEVSSWRDQSPNNNHLEQATLLERPVNGTGLGGQKGTIFFDSTRGENLDMTSQITLTGDWMIGMVLTANELPESGGYTILADNDYENDWMKISAANTMKLRIDGTTVNLSLDAGNTFESLFSIIITRESSLCSVWFNGILQADTELLAGSSDIDNFGVRKTDLNPFDGSVNEIIIFSCYDERMLKGFRKYIEFLRLEVKETL